MEQLDQLKAMRDAAVKMREEAKERLEAKLREIQNGPDARLIAGLEPVIDGYDKVLGLSDNDDEATVENADDVSDTGALAAVEGGKPEPVGEEDDAGTDAKKPAGEKEPAKKAASKPKLMSHKELTKPKAEKTAEEAPKAEPEKPDDKPQPAKAEAAPEPKPEPAPGSRAGQKPTDEEMSLEDSLEAELLGEFGKS